MFELQTNKQVVTYVIYSGNIVNPLNSYVSGINTYNVKVISMIDKNGDDIFENIIQKIKNGKQLEKQDLINLTFTPIMGGKSDKVTRILNAIKIIKDINTEYKYDVESMIYAFASKFLKGKDLEKVKEELKMTELGKIIKDEGKKEKAIETAKIAIKKGMDSETIRDLTGLTIEEIELIKQVMN